MICLKIRTFVVSTTTLISAVRTSSLLWFAWKFVPLWYQQQRPQRIYRICYSCDLLENSYLCGINNNSHRNTTCQRPLWFAWKFVPLWYQQQLFKKLKKMTFSCDLLENSYLCGINNNEAAQILGCYLVVICLKIRTFVVSTTTASRFINICRELWFAWKFVPLWYQQQLLHFQHYLDWSCDLLENSYLCGINNNQLTLDRTFLLVVICLKIRTFVVSTTTGKTEISRSRRLWFAWKFVPLWYQQQQQHEELY